MYPDIPTWQEFEEVTREVLEYHNFNPEFRKVFRDNERRYEIDVVGHKGNYSIAIDCKMYGQGRYRTSALRQEAKRHSERCRVYGKVENRRIIPIIVTSIDDAILINNGCIFVPFRTLNDFLMNFEYYLEILERFIIV